MSEDKNWEDICDKCGKCCEFKFTPDVYCPLFNTETRQCNYYDDRFEINETCVQLTKHNILELYENGTLPKSCKYVKMELH